LKKKKEEEAKAEEDFCCCRASALFGYSSGRYFIGGKAKMYACFFFSWGKEVDFSVIESFFIT